MLALLFIDGVHVVNGSFFSRILQPTKKEGEEGGKTEAPSKATSSMGSEAQVGSIISFSDGLPFATLANNNKIPLVGYGVGNLQHEMIPGMVMAAIQDDKRTRLIDTAHASNNEDLVAEGINRGVAKLNREGKVEVHVVTKVWYTHLGYGRTKLSVEESLKSLQTALDNDKIDLKLHFQLHWPRCFDSIPWMNCQREERELSDHVKDAGPDPTKDPDNAWKESWKYLEDLYLSDKYPIASIGVSNFHLHDIEIMENFARIHPHILQVNVWSLLYDALLVDYCHKHRIHIQVYNAIHGTISQPERAPKAFHHIQKVASEISSELDQDLTAAQVILAWLMQHGVSVIPRTTNSVRLTENSAVALSSIPAFSDHQVETIAHAVEAYLSGDDLEEDIHVAVTFHVVSKDVVLYWMGREGSEVRIGHLKAGETFTDTTYPNHTFRTYDAANKDYWIDHEISAKFGDHKHIHVEL
jgi:aldehyde reductase